MSLQRALQQFTNQQPQRDTRPPSSLLHTRFTRNSRAHERAHCTPRAPLPGLAWLWPGTEVQLGTADGASSLIHLSILSHTHTPASRPRLRRLLASRQTSPARATSLAPVTSERLRHFRDLRARAPIPPKEVSSLVVRLAVLLPARTDAPAANPCSWLPNARTSTSARPLVSSSQFLAIAALMSRPEKFPAPPRHHWNDTAVASSQAFPPPRAHYSGTVESTTEADSASRNLLQRHTLAPDASIYRHLQSSCLEHHSVAI